MKEYHKIKFNSGLDIEGYQVVENGVQLRLTDLNGVDVVLPRTGYGLDFVQTDAPIPAWAPQDGS